MATMNVKDAAGTPTAVEKPLAPGQAAMAASRPVAIASDQTAVPVSLSSVPSHAVTNAGTFVTQENGAALTALQLLDDTVTAQGTALGSTKTNLMGGSVSSSSPTYTTGQINPLSLDTSGNLRVNVVAGGGSGGTSSTVGSAAPSTATAIGFTDGTNMRLGVIKAASTAPVATDPAIVVAVSPNSQNANGQTTKANSTPVTLASDDNATVSLALLDDVIFTDDAAFTPATSKVAAIGMQADETSTDSVDEGDIGAPRMTLDRKQITTVQPHTQGGCQIIRKIDLDEAPVAVKASAGQIYGFYIVNRVTSPRYLRFYNIASGSVTVGTSTVAVGPIEIPSNASDHTAFVVNFPVGIEFSTAISMAATTGFADNDTGAPGTNDLIINVLYK